MWIHLLTLGLIDGAGGESTQATIPTNEVGRVYVRRGKKVYFFNSPEEADRFLVAEQEAQQVIEKAQKTSRRARKRLKEKVYPVADSVDLIELEALAIRFDYPINVERLYRERSFEELMQVAEALRQLQDEEDVELLLLS